MNWWLGNALICIRATGCAMPHTLVAAAVEPFQPVGRAINETKENPRSVEKFEKQKSLTSLMRFVNGAQRQIQLYLPLAPTTTASRKCLTWFFEATDTRPCNIISRSAIDIHLVNNVTAAQSKGWVEEEVNNQTVACTLRLSAFYSISKRHRSPKSAYDRNGLESLCKLCDEPQPSGWRGRDEAAILIMSMVRFIALLYLFPLAISFGSHVASKDNSWSSVARTETED